VSERVYLARICRQGVFAKTAKASKPAETALCYIELNRVRAGVVRGKGES
jgi:hypothetical protein